MLHSWFPHFSRTFQWLLIIFQGPFFVKNSNFGVFINVFYQISDHGYQWNYNIVDYMTCRPTLFIDSLVHEPGTEILMIGTILILMLLFI